MAEKLGSQRVDLTDGRKVHVLDYDDGSVRIRMSGSPYLLKECYLQGKDDEAILGLVRVEVPVPVPDAQKSGYKWTRAEFSNEAAAEAYARNAVSTRQLIEGPNPPKAPGEPWVVWSKARVAGQVFKEDATES